MADQETQPTIYFKSTGAGRMGLWLMIAAPTIALLTIMFLLTTAHEQVEYGIYVMDAAFIIVIVAILGYGRKLVSIKVWADKENLYQQTGTQKWSMPFSAITYALIKPSRANDWLYVRGAQHETHYISGRVLTFSQLKQIQSLI